MNTDTKSENFRIHGWVLAVASPLVLIGLANHPVASSYNILDAIRSMIAIGYINAVVHGTLMFITIVLLFGFVGLSRSLGMDRPLVQAGLIAQSVATFAALCAGTIDGFVFRGIARLYADATPEQGELVRGLFRLSGSLVNVWGRIWLIALAAAMILWSFELLRRDGPARHLGAYGATAGLIGALVTVSGFLPLSVLVTASTFGSIALWGMIVGILLLRDRLGTGARNA